MKMKVISYQTAYCAKKIFMGFITINKRYLWYFSIRLLNAKNPYVTDEQHEEEESSGT